MVWLEEDGFERYDFSHLRLTLHGKLCGSTSRTFWHEAESVQLTNHVFKKATLAEGRFQACLLSSRCLADQIPQSNSGDMNSNILKSTTIARKTGMKDRNWISSSD